eukprot:PhF_6_TR13919/c0_g2_i1/m.22380
MESLKSVTSMFDLLRYKRSNTGESCSVNIPDTLVFHNGALRLWLFTDSLTGQILFREKREYGYDNILDVFASTQRKGKLRTEVVAVTYIMRNRYGEGKYPLTASFLTLSQLEEFLTHRADGFEGIVQKFIPPSSNRNHIIQVLWTPYVTTVSKLENLRSMLDPKFSQFEKHCTFEGPLHDVKQVTCGAGALPELSKAVEAINAYIAENQRRVVSRVVAYFKYDEDGGHHLLFTTHILMTARARPPACFSDACGPLREKIRNESVSLSFAGSVLPTRSQRLTPAVLRLQRKRYALRLDPGFLVPHEVKSKGRMSVKELDVLRCASAELERSMRTNSPTKRCRGSPRRQREGGPSTPSMTDDEAWELFAPSYVQLRMKLANLSRRCIGWLRTTVYELLTADRLRASSFAFTFPSYIPQPLQQHLTTKVMHLGAEDRQDQLKLPLNLTEVPPRVFQQVFVDAEVVVHEGIAQTFQNLYEKVYFKQFFFDEDDDEDKSQDNVCVEFKDEDQLQKFKEWLETKIKAYNSNSPGSSSRPQVVVDWIELPP